MSRGVFLDVYLGFIEKEECGDTSVQNSERLLAFNNGIKKDMQLVLGKPS